MPILTTFAKEHIRNHALEFPDKEVCGAILKDGTPIRWKNYAANEATGFLTPSFDPGTIAAIYHSHPDGQGDDFSVKDIKASRALGKPFILFYVPTQIFRFYDPNKIEPYLGREWNWVYRNCYTLVQDYYKQELGIVLNDYYLESPRSWLRKSVGYVENFQKEGFRRLREDESIQKHDVILLWQQSKFPNHAAIVVDPNKNHILEHLENRLSHLTIYGGQLIKQTHSVLRWAGKIR